LEEEIEPDWSERKLKSRINKMLTDFDPNDPSWQWPDPEAAEQRKRIALDLNREGVRENEPNVKG
jgi:hypothetical protein